MRPPQLVTNYGCVMTNQKRQIEAQFVGFKDKVTENIVLKTNTLASAMTHQDIQTKSHARP